MYNHLKEQTDPNRETLPCTRNQGFLKKFRKNALHGYKKINIIGTSIEPYHITNSTNQFQLGKNIFVEIITTNYFHI